MADTHGVIFEKLVTKATVYDYKTPATKVVHLLGKKSAVVVMKDGQYYGMLDPKSLGSAMQGLEIKGASIEKYTAKVPKITSHTMMDDLVSLFYKSRAKALPFVSGNKVKGILERSTVLKILLSLNSLRGLKVNAAMRSPIVAIDSGANIAQAQALMTSSRVGRLVVLDGGKFFGIVTKHDLLTQYATSDSRLPEMKSVKYMPSNINLGSIANRNVYTIDHNRGLADAAIELVERNVSSLVVTKASAPVGILTVHDILESVVARKRIEPNRIFISGVGEFSPDYEDEARSILSEFLDRTGKVGKAEADYITLHVRRVKTRSYEMEARLSLGSSGIISVHGVGYLFEDTLKELLLKLKKELMRKKDRYVTGKRMMEHNDGDI
ncbi:MAG: CBS domain-containing protein [Candidatus Marsarchaeota archaeon]|jgi:signal-transduction protein with cAMP-binding, CBS, and nucleotidyltransferase domain|nr:CBS domain-containing protein [Candidatus Marsarchaeota archaeon]